MSKSNALETELLQLLFNGTAIGTVADNAATGALTNLYVSLHTGDPGDAGDQGTSESAYTSYARVAVARTTTGWSVSAGVASPIAAISFPAATDTGPNITHFAIGESATATGGEIWFSGTVTPNISIANGVTPQLTTGTTITED